MKSDVVSIEGIIKANNQISAVVLHTPLQHNVNLSERYGCKVFLKREDLQKVRSYKIRGAYNLISQLTYQERANGVICASAGNHAQGVAFACNELKIKGHIYMPTTTPRQKVTQVKMFGKEYVKVILTGDTFDDSYNQALEFGSANNLVFVHPFDDVRVIEGQGTVGKEIMEDSTEKIDFIFVPIGGGGLAAGLSTYVKSIDPQLKIIGVEPEGAPAMFESLKQKKVVQLQEINKFVDGAAVKSVGKIPFPICQKYLEEVLLVPEGKACSTILQLYNEEAIVVEPAGSLSIAALDLYKDQIKGKTVVCIVSGSNNDIARMQEIKERSLLYEGILHYFIIRFPQRAGALRTFLNEVLGTNDDITRFEYIKKTSKESGPALVGIELKNRADYQSLIDRMEKYNISYTTLNDSPNLFDYFI